MDPRRWFDASDALLFLSAACAYWALGIAFHDWFSSRQTMGFIVFGYLAVTLFVRALR